MDLLKWCLKKVEDKIKVLVVGDMNVSTENREVKGAIGMFGTLGVNEEG